MPRRVVHFLKRRPGFTVLTVIILAIIAKTVNFKLYVIGWDNFSSYFNPVTNIFRTFFAAWREYRGLGAASDSEAVDIFRQLFSLILRPVFPEPILDQVYMMACLAGGVLGMYSFAYHLYRDSGDKEKSHYLAELFGFVAGFFYLFNLNTAATFSFPMIMYITRFMSLPILLSIFYSLLHHRSVSRKRYAAYIAAIFVLSGSYITGTILITTCILLCSFGLFQGRLVKRFLIIFAFFLTVNMFWLLPFANYTVQKSQLIRLAPTFISANETQSNKPKSFFSASKQLLLYSNFFDTQYTDIKDARIKYSFDSFSQLYRQPLANGVMWVFPALYLIGALLLLLRFKKKWLWIPSTMAFFLIMSMKEYSVFGIIYRFFTGVTPFFDVLFRFSDTKFHVYIAFTASLCAAYTLVFVAEKSKKLAVTGAVILSIMFLLVFRDYFVGKFISPFMYNKIPEAYFQLADYLNSDKDTFRVLHLPYDKEAYWRSYTWGMVGSSFFNFMINHPLIEKTFEPASMENAYLDKNILTLLNHMQSVPTAEEKAQRATAFAALLGKTGIKYVILDDTVRTSVPAKGIVYWGEFNNADARAMVDALKYYDLAETAKTYPVDLTGYDGLYGGNYPLDAQKKKLFAENKKATIELVRLKNIVGPVAFPEQTTSVDPTMDNLLETPLAYQDGNSIEDERGHGADLYPFQQPKGSLSETGSDFTLRLPTQSRGEGNINVQLPSLTVAPDTVLQYVDVYTRITDEGAVISIYRPLTPDINGRRIYDKLGEVAIPRQDVDSATSAAYPASGLMSDWNIFNTKSLGAFRLQVNNLVVPLPAAFPSTDQYLGTVAVAGPKLRIAVLAYGGESEVPLTNIGTTENPNCFNDKMAGADWALKKNIPPTLYSRNQSTCTLLGLGGTLDGQDDHIDFQLSLTASHKDTDSKQEQGMNLTSKPSLRQYVTGQTKPNMMYFCVKPEGFNDGCFNSRQIMDVGAGSRTLTIPLEKPVTDTQSFTALLALKNTGYQEQEVRITAIKVRHYRSILADEFALDYPAAQTVSLPVSITGSSYEVSFPKALSSEALYFTPPTGGMFVSNNSCEQAGGYRTFRMVAGRLVSYIENCNNAMYIPADFDSSHFYFWTLNYNLMSGKFPQLYVDDNYYAYSTGMISLYQGYPDVPGFRLFQKPEMWYEKYLGRPSYGRTFTDASLVPAFGYLSSFPELGDLSPKKYEIKHDAENEGIVDLGSFSTQPLPSQWEMMKITPADDISSYQIPAFAVYNPLLPSLRQVTVRMETSGTYLLRFNEGYDKQWIAYPGLLGTIFGGGDQLAPVKCDGFANCYRITKKDSVPVTQTFYLLYTPERLSILGWIGTVVGIILFARVFRRTSPSSEDGKHTS